MTSALNLISENCKRPFPPLCLILSVSSFPEDHLSSFRVTVCHSCLILQANLSVPSCWGTGCLDLLQALCILTSCSLPRPSFLYFPPFPFLLIVLGFQFTFHCGLMILLWRFFPWTDLLLSALSQCPLACMLCQQGKRIQRFHLKTVLAHFSSNQRLIE